MPRCLTCDTAYEENVAFCPKDGTALGDRLLENRYRIVSKLGAGGMGTVYIAEHVTLGKRVAVKVLKEEISRDPAMAKRFEQEAVAASRIGQENIVDVTDYGRTPEGSLYFVMEFLEGPTLADVLARERVLPVGRACNILLQVCEAIEAAHARGIVHRDLKPHNIVLLDRPGRPDFVKVLDFGVSEMGWRQEPITELGAILGTPEYMAPEQASGESVDPRTDIYAIGVMAYELVTGTLPFRGDHSMATMLKHINELARPPRELRPDLNLPEELDALIMKSLAKRPGDRYQTVSEQRLALGKHLAIPIKLSSVAPTIPRPPSFPPAADVDGRSDTFISSSGKLAAVPRPSQATALAAPAEPIVVPKNKAPWVMLGLVVVGIGVAVGALALRGTPTEAAPVAMATSSVPESAPAPPAPSEPSPAPAAPVPPPAPATPAKLAVKSTPPGAVVFSGHKRLGQTPLELDPPTAATQLRFELAGHLPHVAKVAPGDVEVDVKLAKRTARRQSGAPQSDSTKPFNQNADLKDNPF